MFQKRQKIKLSKKIFLHKIIFKHPIYKGQKNNLWFSLIISNQELKNGNKNQAAIRLLHNFYKSGNKLLSMNKVFNY